MFIYKQWDEFCRKLNEKALTSLTAVSALHENPDEHFIILKHDVETNPKKALRLAQIENSYSLKGSYYVQAYLLHSSKNIEILKRIQELGHEVSYHHDVMDSNKGDIQKAEDEFKKNIEMFERAGFPMQTVCQHGNPVMNRVGYSSNRDFFRNVEMASKYAHITEIMVNFKKRLGRNYRYITDAGYGWKVIFDPETNDFIKSDDKDIPLRALDEVIKVIESGSSVIISTHPHRWHKHVVIGRVKDVQFKAIKTMAKVMLKIPFLKKIMVRFYYLAKKI
jgi:hypothetical protein